MLEKYCLACHDTATAEGAVVLEAIGDQAPAALDRKLLERVADNLRAETMPPHGEPRPDAKELETIHLWLDSILIDPSREARRVNLRRLNRAEYNNTIRDLIELDLHPGDEFPADDIGYGFDHIAEVLSTPPILVEMYLKAADRIVTAAFAVPEVRDRILNPPADLIPIALRRYTPPVRAFRGDKVLRPVSTAPDPELARQQRIYDIVRGFGDRAFRRPATHDEITRLLGIALSAERDGESAQMAVQIALRAVLASPQFLFRIPSGNGADASSPALPSSDFDLASRLSYFLWSSMPDEELFRLATLGTLHSEANLTAQVERMLRSAKSAALARNFGAQWLQIRTLDQFTPDPSLFADFDPLLRSAMVTETRLFFESIQADDRDIFAFVNADYTFVNERLARHYGMRGVAGEPFRRVSLEGTGRGGVLTQASILAVTSNPTRTSPVKRGKWILENLLGAPPPPPPSGVEALDIKKPGAATGPLREQMERHRSDAACATCHRRMDPLGFGLENFDAIGRWRSSDHGRPIDSSGTLPGGQSFNGPSELRAFLLAQRSSFARCLSEKMLTYALGRGLERSDRRTVDQVVTRLAEGGYRFSSLILAVVQSEPFVGGAGSRGTP